MEIENNSFTPIETVNDEVVLIIESYASPLDDE